MADVLGAFEQAVLIAVLQLQVDAYGRAILKEVQARLGRDVAPGAVHATLGRLERKKLLSSKLGSGTPVRAGRARRYYRLRPSGVRALNTARAAVDKLSPLIAEGLGDEGCVPAPALATTTLAPISAAAPRPPANAAPAGGSGQRVRRSPRGVS